MLIELAAMLRSYALRWEGLLSRAALSADWIARAPGSNSYWAWGLSLSPETQSVPLRILRLALSALLGASRLASLRAPTYKVGVSLLTNSKLSEALRLSFISSESYSMSLGIPRHKSPGAPLGFDVSVEQRSSSSTVCGAARRAHPSVDAGGPRSRNRQWTRHA